MPGIRIGHITPEYAVWYGCDAR